MTTEGFVRRKRLGGPRQPSGELNLQAPPEVPRKVPANLFLVLLPGVMLVAMIGMMAVVFTAGGGSALRNPVAWMFPMMMIMSMGAMLFGGFGRGNGKPAAELNEERKDYLRYLGRVRKDVIETEDRQRAALTWVHPAPSRLVPVTATQRMWERRPDDADFCHVRVGSGSQRFGLRLVAPETGPLDDLEPVSMVALRRFIRTHSIAHNMPTAVALRGFPVIGVGGEPEPVRALVRAMVLQLCMFHAPDHVALAIICKDPDGPDWQWAKWLPHLQHPERSDVLGPIRMFYPSLAEFEADHDADLVERGRWGRNAPPQTDKRQWIVLIADGHVTGQERLIVDSGIDGVAVIDLAAPERGLAAREGLELVVAKGMVGVKKASGVEQFAAVDAASLPLAEVVARRMARYKLSTAAQLVDLTLDSEPTDPGLMRLLGVRDAAAIDPATVWRERSARDRLRVPIGFQRDGRPLEIDIKEAAENGMGPHGLCIGATGSGKSEFLRTLVLAMATTHSPDALNLVLVDFKGGATFLGLDDLPHVAAVITNLEEELAMVDRMRDALSGEMNRRQELLRRAGNFANVGDYEKARRNGAQLAPLPALFIVVDEFSELLSQKPDFAELFVAIGRLGRSLHMHLLLASQRLEEGKLRGLDSHLSYRIGLKTFSAAESRTVLGVPDAYHLPNIPGSAYLKCDSTDLLRFNASYVSGPYVRPLSPRSGMRRTVAADGTPVFAREFTASEIREFDLPTERVDSGEPQREAESGIEMRDGRTITLLDVVVDRLRGHGNPAHEVWLPPLRESAPLDAYYPDGAWRAQVTTAPTLTLPMGVVDRPYDQRRDALIVNLSGAQGHVAVVGGPQSGKSTALRTLIMSAAASHAPEQVQFYILDFGGGTMASLSGLPHVGSVASRLDEDRVRRTVAEMLTLLREREARFRDLGIESMTEFRRRKAALAQLPPEQAAQDPLSRDAFGDVFVVVDGWFVVRSEFESIEAGLNTLVSQGLSYGIHVVISASRWMEIRPAVKDLIGTRLELRLGDPGDSEVDRKVAQLVPMGSPGRGLSPQKLHMLIALPRLDGSSHTADLGAGVAWSVTALRDVYGDRRAPAVRMLPERISRADVVAQAWARREPTAASIAIGLDEATLAPLVLDFSVQPNFMAFGDTQCGKTNLLRVILRGLTENAGPATNKIILVDYRRSLLGEVEGNHLAGYATSAQQLADMVGQLVGILRSRQPGPDITPQQLRDRSWWSGPDFYIVVDDYDMVAVSGGNPLVPLVELLPQARDIGLHLILVRRSGGASRAMFDPIIARLKDLSAEGLVMSASKEEGVLLGTTRSAPRPPGRGMHVSRNGEGLIQVAWEEPHA
ncbi:MAG: type VII secretion protein EccCa [Nocardiaceae bacterium]|nr:type VII secretion protein EccCa [Nocardiaceae bacterium]